MNIPVYINVDDILNKIKTIDIIPFITNRDDKFELLEAFSAQELFTYMIRNNIITEDILAELVENKQLNIELLIGKIAAKRLQKTINDVIKSTIPEK